MAIKRAREESMKPPPAAASSWAMAEMPGADHIQAPPPLPPGVYFSPTDEECLQFLNRSIAGDRELPDARGYIFRADFYGESPDALRRRHPPASAREGDHVWWFLSETRFQSQKTSRNKRAHRRVGDVGTWRLDQTKTKLGDDAGFKNNLGFYTGNCKATDKTQWLMQEFTSAMDDSAGKQGMPALYRVYVTPNASDDQLRDTYGEAGIKKSPDGKLKPVRAVVPEKCFDAIAKLLPPGSVHGGVAQESIALPPPPLPVAPTGLVDYYGQQGQCPLLYQQQQQLAPEVDIFGQYQQQQGQCSVQYQQLQHAPEVDIVGQYQQQEPFFGVAPLLSEVVADTPLDNLSMSMAEFMGMFNEQPAVMANGELAVMASEEPAEMGQEQPAETSKEGEPNWDSLGSIVDDNVF